MKKYILILFILVIDTSTAQSKYPDLKLPVPMDSEVKVGRLDNGLTYYIRANAQPKERTSFYLIQKVGAILEEDNEDGLAHLLEHMAFSSLKHFPGRKGFVSVLENYGVQFGRNLNAYTSLDETIYNISEVPTSRSGIIDTCLLVLNDWASGIMLEEKEINDERAIILEEARTTQTAEVRLRNKSLPVILNDSKYAKRDVIGNLDIIRNVKPEILREYYKKWYRPDLQCVAIVGDFDAEEMEKKVIELFSQIPVCVNPTPRPEYKIEPHMGMKYVLATDKEAPQSMITVYCKYPATPVDQKNYEYVREGILMTMFNSMMSERIGELMTEVNPAHLGASCGFNTLEGNMDMYSMFVIAKPGMESQALESVWSETLKIKRYGFTQEEFNRVKTNLLMGTKSAYEQNDLTHSEKYIEEISAHFLKGEPLQSFKDYCDFVNEVAMTATVEEISSLANKYVSRDNMVIVVAGPPTGAKHITEQEAIAALDKAETAELKPYKDQKLNVSFVTKNLKGSKIVATKQLPQFNAEEWKLANGATVVFRKTDFEKDNISVTSYSPGGMSLYDTKLLPAALVVNQFMPAHGLGKYDASTLKKLLTGKQVNVMTNIGVNSESVNGVSSVKDFETMMQLLYLTFEKPRFDKATHEGIMSMQRASISGAEVVDAQSMMQDSISLIMTNYSPRTMKFDTKFLDKLKLKDIEYVYRDRIKDASDFIFFIVGNIDASTVKPIVEKYLGSVKSYGRKETCVDNNECIAKGHTDKTIVLPFETPKATVITHFSKDMKYTPADNLYLNILKGVLDLRLLETIRETEGGTYGVSVQINLSRTPKDNYTLSVSFDCDPARAKKLQEMVHFEINKIKREGVTVEEIEKLTTIIKKNRELLEPHNSFWVSVLTSYYLNNEDVTAPENYLTILNNVKPSNIKDFTNRFLDNADALDLVFTSKN